MLPEISHRCPSCGASVRDSDALFCPECGKVSVGQAKSSETQATQLILQSRRKPARLLKFCVLHPRMKHRRPRLTNRHEPATRTDRAGCSRTVRGGDDSAAVADTKDDVSSQPAHRRGEKTRERLHRASEVARGVGRGVIEEPAKRVEKIRHASTVVIEEASYDPSLRFVLVALGLFVVFVILLVLSKVMG